jgi:hypothetical protein
MISAGNAAFSPIIDPTMIFVKGINRTIKIMNGIDLKILTIALNTKLTGWFSHILPLEVKKSSSPRIAPRMKVATTDMALMYSVSTVASHIRSQLTLGNNVSAIRNHLHADFMLADILDCPGYFALFTIKMDEQGSIRTILCLRNFTLDNIDRY